jgi:hypothetical protein
MLTPWLQDIESLEAISQDDQTRNIVLHLAELSRAGGLLPFLAQLDWDRDLDAATKASCAELARDAAFLNAVEEYVRRTSAFH